MSLKVERLNKSFMREISMILASEVKDEKVKDVTITDVKITSDLSIAKVYVRVLNDEEKDDVLKGLDRAKGFIRSKLFERHDMKHIPELKFVYDESVDYGNKIEKIIDSLND